MSAQNRKAKIPILLFADSLLGIQPYPWQCKILLNYEAGFPTAAACANFTVYSFLGWIRLQIRQLANLQSPA
jgi:hypothetical protein